MSTTPAVTPPRGPFGYTCYEPIVVASPNGDMTERPCFASYRDVCIQVHLTPEQRGRL